MKTLSMVSDNMSGGVRGHTLLIFEDQRLLFF